jgi:hypothetical protein
MQGLSIRRKSLAIPRIKLGGGSPGRIRTSDQPVNSQIRIVPPTKNAKIKGKSPLFVETRSVGANALDDSK